MDWLQGSTMFGQQQTHAVVARYKASISTRLLNSETSFNPDLSFNDIVPVLRGGLLNVTSDKRYRTARPKSIDELTPWLLIKLERAMALRGSVTQPDRGALQEWLETHYPFYDERSDNTSKIFPFEAQLLEDSGVAWTFADSESGEFPIQVKGGRWDPLRLFISTIVRIDMLEKIESATR